MFINLSNHPSQHWDVEQLEAALVYGQIVDMEFPYVDPQWTTDIVEECAQEYLRKIMECVLNNEEVVVHLAGESIFCFLLAQLLLNKGYKCLASTTERIVTEDEGVKKSIFKFKIFREYRIMK